MGYQSNIRSTLLDYLVARKVMAVLGFYVMSSILVFVFFDVNAMIPCVFKSFFHFECFGCGLTSALIELLHFNFKGAYDKNPLIYVVLPILCFGIWKDFKRFKTKENKEVRNY